jgi:hypothetical protein
LAERGSEVGSPRGGDGGGGGLGSSEMGQPPTFKTDEEGSGKAALTGGTLSGGIFCARTKD